MSIDFPRAWEIAASVEREYHHNECGFNVSRGGVLCDCDVIHKHPEYTDKINFYGAGGIAIQLRKDAETERAIQRAAEVLPEGWSIEIEVEKDAGSVAVLGPGAVVYGDFQGTIAEQILDAIDTAMQEAAHESH